MGQKVHPIGFRLGVVKGWQSRWYAERDYKDILAEDLLIRKTILHDLANAMVSKIEIERAAANQVWVAIHTARPGIVIGKSGEKVEKLKSALEAKTKKRVRLEIKEIRQPDLDAYLVARTIAEQLEKRVSFRRAMKQAVQKSMRANAKGVKIVVGGRLGGAEIARSEKEVEGKIPLHTLRTDIDYGLAEAHTTFGVIGVKVWIYKGDILPSKRREAGEARLETATQPAAPSHEREGGERRGERRRPAESGGPRRERGQRPQGDRPQASGTRAPAERTTGERPARQQGERPSGERPPRTPRATGERPARQQGERPSGERPPRTPRAQSERPARQQSEHPAPPSEEHLARPTEEQPPEVIAAPETPPSPTEQAPGSTESE